MCFKAKFICKREIKKKNKLYRSVARQNPEVSQKEIIKSKTKFRNKLQNQSVETVVKNFKEQYKTVMLLSVHGVFRLSFNNVFILLTWTTTSKKRECTITST